MGLKCFIFIQAQEGVVKSENSWMLGTYSYDMAKKEDIANYTHISNAENKSDDLGLFLFLNKISCKLPF